MIQFKVPFHYLVAILLLIISYYQGLDWEDVLNKRIPAPFKPRVRGEMDVGNFAEEFTTMPPVDSPAFPPQSAKRFAQIFRVGESWVLRVVHILNCYLTIFVQCSVHYYVIHYINPSKIISILSVLIWYCQVLIVIPYFIRGSPLSHRQFSSTRKCLQKVQLNCAEKNTKSSTTISKLITCVLPL